MKKRADLVHMNMMMSLMGMMDIMMKLMRDRCVCVFFFHDSKIGIV
jgi:hypothetical protein